MSIMENIQGKTINIIQNRIFKRKMTVNKNEDEKKIRKTEKMGGAWLLTGSVMMSAMLLLTACGGGSSSSVTSGSVKYANDAADSVMMEEAYEYDGDYGYDSYESAEAPKQASGNSGGNEGENEGENAAAGRKLIRNMDMSVETEEYEPFLAKLDARIRSVGGYVENSTHYMGSYGYEGTRSSSYTVRVPATRLDEFVEVLGEIGHITRKNETTQDITLSYVDTKSRKESLQVEQKRLLELLEKAETIEDIITIESRLSDIRYEVENYESRLRTYDNQVEYSTVYMDIEEVKRYTPVEEPGFFEKISVGFADSLEGVWEDIKNFVIWFVVNLPYIVVRLFVLFILVLIIRFISKAVARSGAMKSMKRMKKEQENGRGESRNDIHKKGFPFGNRKGQPVTGQMPPVAPPAPTAPTTQGYYPPQSHAMADEGQVLQGKYPVEKPDEGTNQPDGEDTGSK